MLRVKKIQIVNGKDSRTFVAYENGVGDIVDNSMEFEDSISQIILCYDTDGNLIRSIENCPVIIDYVVEEKGNVKK